MELLALPLLALVQAPFLLMFAWPWLLGAWIVAPMSRGWMAIVRIPFRALPVAIGCAPVEGAHGSVFPASLVLSEFGARADAFLSIAVTWFVFSAVGIAVATARGATPTEASAQDEEQRGEVRTSPFVELDRWVRAGIVSWIAILVVSPIAQTMFAYGPGALASWAVSPPLWQLAERTWSSLPESLLAVFFIALPAESLARESGSFSIRFAIRSVAWLAVSASIPESTESIFHRASFVALLTGSSVAWWVMTRLGPFDAGSATVGDREQGGFSGVAARALRLRPASCALGLLTLVVHLFAAGKHLTPRDLVTLRNETGDAMQDVEFRIGEEVFRYDSILPDEGRDESPHHRFGDAEYVIHWRDTSGRLYDGKLRGDCFGDSFADLVIEASAGGRVQIWTPTVICRELVSPGRAVAK